MNTRSLYFAILAFALVMIAATALAQDSEEDEASSSSVGLDLAYVSKYVWRGIPLNPDPAVQPSLTFEHKSGLSLNVWGSVDTTDVAGNEWDLTEVDYTLNYGWTNKLDHEINVGVVSYTFPNTDFATTSEVYSSYCFDGKLTPTIQVNYDFVKADGFYGSLSAGYECGLSYIKSAPSLGLSARVGFGTTNHNLYNYGADTSGFTDVQLGAALPIKVSPKITVTPSINYAAIIDDDIRDAFDVSGLDNTNFYAGVTVGIAF